MLNVFNDLIPGMHINSHLPGNRVVPKYDVIDNYVTYHEDGRVHGTSNFFDNGKLVKWIQEHYSTNTRKIKMFKGDIVIGRDSHGLDKWIDEHIFFHGGGYDGPPIKDYETSNKRHPLFQVGTSITNGSFFRLRGPIQPNKVDDKNDFVVDVRHCKRTIINTYLFLCGKYYDPPLRENADLINYYSKKVDDSRFPIIECVVQLRENYGS